MTQPTINPMSMDGRTVMVTGASSGIGRETAIALSELGAKVVCVGRDRARLDETAASLVGNQHHVLQREFGDTNGIERWMQEVIASVGPLTGLAHCAGIQASLPLRVLSASRMRELWTVNVESAALLVKGFQQPGVYADSSSIVLISSTSALVGVPGNAIYGGTKAALMALARSFALELATKKIRVNCVTPAIVETEMVARFRETMSEESYQQIVKQHPLGVGQPRDVANAIAFLLSPASRWVTGTQLILDGGLTAL